MQLRRNRNSHTHIRAALATLIHAIKRDRGCEVEGCEEKDTCCLQFHHLDPKKKYFSIGKAVKQRMRVEQIMTEIAKCKVVCANHHAKLNAGRVVRFRTP